MENICWEGGNIKIKVELTIGYASAKRSDILEIDNSELDGKTPEEKYEYLQQQTQEWADEYIECWYEEIK